MPVMTPDDLHRFLKEEFPQAPPGIRVEQIDDTKIRVRQVTSERNLRPGGTISGPTLMAMVDCGFYLLLLGRLLKLGKTLAVGDFTIWSEGQTEPVAHATVTYVIPAKR